MARGETKHRLLEAGRNIFLEKGYNHAGIEAILQVAGVPKGSFYNYFGSKEDFGLQVINQFARGYNEELEQFLANSSLGPLGRLRAYFESIIDRLDSIECRNGCLVGNLSQEMADQSEVFRARLEEIFECWVDRYADCLAQAQEAGEIPSDLDVRELAEFLLNSWQGAILRAKTARSSAPLHIFLTITFRAIAGK
ncbi:MAG: transcriptional regulator [Planctomycetota bacterium]|nr:transcriptional regulator [Planctomycetota bacterium]